jgi:hypothetical protein
MERMINNLRTLNIISEDSSIIDDLFVWFDDLLNEIDLSISNIE